MAQLKAKLGRLARFDTQHITHDELVLVLTEVHRCIAAACTATAPAPAAARLVALSEQTLANLAAMAPPYLTQAQISAVLHQYLVALKHGVIDYEKLPAPVRQEFFAAAAEAVRSLVQQVQAPPPVLTGTDS